MSNPQQPELARSRKTPAQDPDAAASVIEGQPQPGDEGRSGPVPVDNQPGHHPAEEQDKPDLDAFAAKLGTAPPEDRPAIEERIAEDRAPQGAGASPSSVAARLASPRARFAFAAGGLALVALFLARRRRRRA